MAKTVTFSRPRARKHTSHDARSRRMAMERLEALANLLDSAVVIPGTNITVGLDALVGLLPGIGDTITTLVSLWIVKEAHGMGVPRHIVARMIGNVAVDGVVGAVPVLGDAFDIMWRSNRRNMKLLREHFERKGFD